MYFYLFSYTSIYIYIMLSYIFPILYISLLYFSLHQEVDLVAAALTINDARETVVDFTAPYWEEPSVVLLRKPSDRKYLYFTKPFQGVVWLLILLTVAVSGTAIFLFSATGQHITKARDKAKPDSAPGLHQYVHALWAILLMG